MKKTCILALAALCLALPATGAAQGLPDFLTAVGEGVQEGVAAGAAAVAESEELTLALELGDTRMEAGKPLTLTVTAVNPRAADTPVALTLSLPDRLTCAQGASWEAILPAAKPGEPSMTVFEREVTLAPGGVSETAELVCEMSMGTRFYRARQAVDLCVADISVTAALNGADDGRVQPGDAFAWRIEVKNAGTAARDVALDLTLPEGVTLQHEAACALRKNGTRLTGTVRAEAAKAGEASVAVIELPVRVDEDALEGDEDAVRLMTGALFADGERVPLPRVQVCGPKISVRLVPDADELEAGETMALRVMVVNEGLAPADVELSCVLPEGLTLEKDKQAKATPAEAAVMDGEDGALPPQGVPADSVLPREQTITAAKDNRVTFTAHMDAANEGESGVTASTQVFEMRVKAQAPQKNLQEKLVGTALAYSVDGGPAQLSEAVAMRVYIPAFLGITNADWGGIFWASLLLLVTVVCLWAAVRSDDKEEYCCD